MIGLKLSSVVLVWMTALVPAERVPWGDTYPETAYAITEVCEENIRCAAVMVALAYHESRFDPNAEGDHGASYGLFQVAKSWGRPATVDEQVRLARALVLRSRRICAGRDPLEALGWYASGGPSCGRPEASRTRMSLAKSLLQGR